MIVVDDVEYIEWSQSVRASFTTLVKADDYSFHAYKKQSSMLYSVALKY